MFVAQAEVYEKKYSEKKLEFEKNKKSWFFDQKKPKEGVTAFSITTLSIMTLSRKTLSIKSLSRKTLSIMTLSPTVKT